MALEDKVLLAQKDKLVANDLIEKYKNFILSCAQKTVGRYITEHDDGYSIALIAFNEAIHKYDVAKGSFLNFSRMVIKNRLIDNIRKESKNENVIPLSQLVRQDEDGKVTDFDIEDKNEIYSDIKFEIEALSSELSVYGISYMDLAKVTPKSKKTKAACFSAIKFLTDSSILVNEVKLKKLLPIQAILNRVDINRKTIERHRKYILAAVIILSGEYDNIAGYFSEIRGGAGS